jgi:hypothetical protein
MRFEVCQAGPSANPPQPPATTAAEASPAPQMAYVPYQPRTGAYPVAWGYHYPTFPTPIAASSATPSAGTHGDSVTSITASGTFAYPYTGVQYSTGQSAYVAPPIKYPYGAPALPTATSSSSVEAKSASPSEQTQKERTYNGIHWKQPYTGPRDSSTPVELQAQNEPSSSTDQQTPTPAPDNVSLPLTDGDDAAPSGDHSVSSSAS